MSNPLPPRNDIASFDNASSGNYEGSGNVLRRVSNEPTIRLLIVDDDELDLINVQRAFARAGVSVSTHTASGGIEALDMLRNKTIDLDRLILLVDIQMPRMSGLEFLRDLRADPRLKSLPVVILTTSNHERDREQAYQLGANAYLVKSVEFERFVEMMRALYNFWSKVSFP